MFETETLEAFGVVIVAVAEIAAAVESSMSPGDEVLAIAAAVANAAAILFSLGGDGIGRGCFLLYGSIGPSFFALIIFAEAEDAWSSKEDAECTCGTSRPKLLLYALAALSLSL